MNHWDAILCSLATVLLAAFAYLSITGIFHQ